MTKPNICPNCRANQDARAKAEAEVRKWKELAEQWRDLFYRPEPLPRIVTAHLERRADTQALFEGWPR